MKALACLFAATLLLAPVAGACESNLVSLGDHSVEVLHMCGEPASRSFIGYSETSSCRLSNVDSQRN
ncbi:DUF2845 domain-containing protein [Pseudomonas sp. BN102]|uniref:DUF2845 domain-containing protein n=1 Tax=Pseudomonas sp. BN102 TaxID=2567886 RepID=UPI0024548F1A|nr:DUF2845 domain-containing protein [Pseudomonas sp. BN102]MDH4611616.1 DUF2845 domain-containing protein [Pseudomonas sp. BN102]